MILWYGLCATLLASLIGFLASWWWLTQEPSPEPMAALYTSAAIFIFSLLALPVQFFFDEERKKRSLANGAKKRTAFDCALDSLDGEMSNIRHMEVKRPYSGEPHRRAVEDTSLKLLGASIEELLQYYWYRKDARRVLEEIARVQNMPRNQKDVSRLIPMLVHLRPRLERALNKLGGAAKW